MLFHRKQGPFSPINAAHQEGVEVGVPPQITQPILPTQQITRGGASFLSSRTLIKAQVDDVLQGVGTQGKKIIKNNKKTGRKCT